MCRADYVLKNDHQAGIHPGALTFYNVKLQSKAGARTESRQVIFISRKSCIVSSGFRDSSHNVEDLHVTVSFLVPKFEC